MANSKEIEKRRTFAIISHPDAGKTTLTEKFLLYGGAIQTAGAVKSNKIKKTATSDFMEIEKQRGISVTTSVMTFNYSDKRINILDTPGHKDFSEDTYRTLTAVDSVILVVDVANGVEAQTKRLMEVCAMRRMPVIIFINKLDREGKDPFDLLDELETTLKVKACPLTWPIGIGSTFKGVYSLYNKNLNLFESKKTKIEEDVTEINSLADEILVEKIGKKLLTQLKQDVDLVKGVYDKFSIEEYQKGNLAPIFFGSALNNFGIKELLETFVEISPFPQSRLTNVKEIAPTDTDFSGFVFKIYANLDPKHRDRIAFLRICSGVFERNKFYNHVRQKKKMKFSSPTSFIAQDKSIVDIAYPGDVIGLYDTGNFKIGDTLTEGKDFSFQGIPNFSPEIFKELENKDPMKSKQLEKGINQLTDEGVAQLFTLQPGNRKIVGTVGELQFDVIQYRLKHEYNASAKFVSKNFFKACWITSKNEAQLDKFIKRKVSNIANDKDGNFVFIAGSAFLLDNAKLEYPEVEFHDTSEFKNEVI